MSSEVPAPAVDRRLADLLRLLDIEALEVNLFRGESRDIGTPQVYGGQVLGQALVAANRTIDGRRCHSLHAYFLRPGDFNAPIVYDVDRSRDGKSFSSRRVVAIQHGEQIFHLSASFAVDEPGFEHAMPMPDVPPPDSLPSFEAYLAEHRDQAGIFGNKILDHNRPFDYRFADLPPYIDRTPRPAYKRVWFRTVDRIPSDDPDLHRAILAYASDANLMDTALMPHAVTWERMQLASIDHAIWFHHPCRVDEWLLYVLDSPSAAGSRGFARGSIYTADGLLCASTAQEGLMRQR